MSPTIGGKLNFKSLYTDLIIKQKEKMSVLTDGLHVPSINSGAM